MMSLSVDIVAIIVISTGKTADRAEKARGAWFSPTQKPSGCLSIIMMMVVMVIMKIENRKVIIGDHQAVAELADLRDGLIQLARTRLSFRQVQLISSIVIIS